MKVVQRALLLSVMGWSVGVACSSTGEARGFFTKSKKFVVKAITAPVRMVTGLFHKNKEDQKTQGTPEVLERVELYKGLVKRRNDLLWINQKMLLEDLVDNKSTKITRGEMFIRELEHEEKILSSIEKEMSLLCYDVANDKVSDKKFVKEVQESLLQTILLKERMHKLLQVVKTK